MQSRLATMVLSLIYDMLKSHNMNPQIAISYDDVIGNIHRGLESGNQIDVGGYSITVAVDYENQYVNQLLLDIQKAYALKITDNATKEVKIMYEVTEKAIYEAMGIDANN